MTENDAALKEAGLKVTHPRVRILELFQSDPKTHYSAEEVHNYLIKNNESIGLATIYSCLLYTSPSPRDRQKSRMPSSA